MIWQRSPLVQKAVRECREHFQVGRAASRVVETRQRRRTRERQRTWVLGRVAMTVGVVFLSAALSSASTLVDAIECDGPEAVVYGYGRRLDPPYVFQFDETGRLYLQGLRFPAPRERRSALSGNRGVELEGSNLRALRDASNWETVWADVGDEITKIRDDSTVRSSSRIDAMAALFRSHALVDSCAEKPDGVLIHLQESRMAIFLPVLSSQAVDEDTEEEVEVPAASRTAIFWRKERDRLCLELKLGRFIAFGADYVIRFTAQHGADLLEEAGMGRLSESETAVPEQDQRLRFLRDLRASGAHD